MDDMMRMSFNELRGEVAPAASSMVAGGSLLGGHPSGPSLMGPSAVGTALLMGGGGQRTVEVPDHQMELRVLFYGPDAQRAAASSAGSVQVADGRIAAAACMGKRDFILFEPLDSAVREQRRLVLVLPLSTGPRDAQQAQVYLASSLAGWLYEQKTDGSGRPYGESKDQDPTLRKFFTRAQILAIRSFGDLDQ